MTNILEPIAIILTVGLDRSLDVQQAGDGRRDLVMVGIFVDMGTDTNMFTNMGTDIIGAHHSPDAVRASFAEH